MSAPHRAAASAAPVVGATSGDPAAGRIDADPARLPVNDVGLVLGTSKQTRGGYRNPHFYDRLDAAAALYHAGRVRHLLLSGDNGSRAYDEPSDRRDALVERGEGLGSGWPWSPP